MKKCCPSCIGDKKLRNQIFHRYSTQIKTGKCYYCKTSDESLIDPQILGVHFESLIEIYNEDESGIPLVDLLKKDWSMFHPDMDTAHSKELLADILNDGEIVRKNFIPSNLIQSKRLANWEKLKEDLMYTNRFFPKIKDAEEEILNGDSNSENLLQRLTKLLPQLTFNPNETTEIWHRTRIQLEDKPFEIQDMGAPPKDKASPGRANPAGIPYLYLSSDQDTSVHEIRPHIGELVNVADLSLVENLNVINLQNPRDMISPFMIDEKQELELLRGGDLEFLERLGQELSRPVLPRSAAIDYIPSQYLCEFIKNCGYDGVIYKSAVGSGSNLALFSSSSVKKFHNVLSRKVHEIRVRHESL